MDDLPDLPSLRPIDPPSGGLSRLRARLDDETERTRWWIPALLAAAAAAAVWWWWPRATSAPAAPMQASNGALRDPRVVDREDVAFYWVASTALPPPSTSTPAPVRAPTLGPGETLPVLTQ